MGAPEGNQFWKLRSRHGVSPMFDNPEDLWEACCEYFEWCDNNPLQEQKAFAYQGEVTKESVTKMRAYTLTGLELYLDIGASTWGEWRRDRKDLAQVVAKVEKVIYTQKFTGAAADLLNSNIIARDLGLADRKEHTGENGGPIETITRTIVDPSKESKG